MYELLFHPEAESEIYDLEPIMQAKVLKGLEKLEAEKATPLSRYRHYPGWFV